MWWSFYFITWWTILNTIVRRIVSSIPTSTKFLSWNTIAINGQCNWVNSAQLPEPLIFKGGSRSIKRAIKSESSLFILTRLRHRTRSYITFNFIKCYDLQVERSKGPLAAMITNYPKNCLFGVPSKEGRLDSRLYADTNSSLMGLFNLLIALLSFKSKRCKIN